MRIRRTAAMAATLIMSASLLAACGGADDEKDSPAPAPAVSSESEGESGQGEGQSDESNDQDASTSQAESDLPRIGKGDPMLGVTDGVDRPEIEKIDTEDLESTNVLEQTERFRRYLAGDASGDDWFTQMQSVADPSFAASLRVSDRDLLREYAGAATDIEVSSSYVIGIATGPYASVAGSDDDGNELWVVRLSFHASKADPSIGTWKAVSIDWPEDSDALDSNDLPFSEDTRATVQTTAAFASSSVFTQSPGDNEKTRAELMKRYFSDPKKAKKIEVPFPERNVTAVAGDPIGRYFSTPSGSKDIWVEINNTSHVVSPSGDPDPEQEPVQNVVYVKLSYSDGDWIAVDAQKGKP